MLAGRVIGNATATVKHPSMKGFRLLVVQPQMADRVSPDGDPLLVVDTIGAGVGQEVMLTSDGRGARATLNSDKTPVRWTLMGIRD